MVSIIVPTRNRAAFIGECLESVRAQTHLNWECLVVDDHSTDETGEILASVARQDSRFVYYLLPAGLSGANAARNWGVERARGDFVLFLDSDDALAPRCLEKRVADMTPRRDLDFGVFPTLLFQTTPGDSDIVWNLATDEADLDRYLALDVPWQTAGILWRREALAKIGPWRDPMPSWQDWEFHLRALRRGLSYRRFDRGESYWRTPRTDSLWEKSKSLRHLQARLDLLACISRDLKKETGWNEHRKHLLGGLWFWHACQCYSKHHRRMMAVAIWMRAWKLKLIPAVQFLHGLRWFSRFLRGPQDQLELVFPRWPIEYRTGCNQTFQRLKYTPPDPDRG